ncbi:hypothetical protein Gasu2_15820 [Galdieria sulphuraria]|nr:hypothetical protein Gasu2_15820 [Galdieria sulphuraria]
MYSLRHSTSHPLGREADWRQFLLAVEPSVERGMNLGVYSLKNALQEYEKSLNEWFLWKRDKLQMLMGSESNSQLRNIVSESIKDSTTAFPEWTLLVQEKLKALTKTVEPLNAQLFMSQDLKFYQRRVFKILKESFMEVFVTRVERRCRKLFGSFSNSVDKKLSKVLIWYRHQVEEKLQELEEQSVQLEQAVKTVQNAQVRDYRSEVSRVLIDRDGSLQRS